jgi:hypothetical protein
VQKREFQAELADDKIKERDNADEQCRARASRMIHCRNRLRVALPQGAAVYKPPWEGGRFGKLHSLERRAAETVATDQYIRT